MRRDRRQLADPQDRDLHLDASGLCDRDSMWRAVGHQRFSRSMFRSIFHRFIPTFHETFQLDNGGECANSAAESLAAARRATCVNSRRVVLPLKAH